MTTPLLNDLKKVIDGYLDGHRSRNLASLSRVSGVAYTTLRRFAQMEGHPTVEPVLKILDAALKTNEKIVFIKKHFPEIATSITNYAGRDYKGEEPGREELKMFVRRVPHNYVLNLATNVAGTDVATISRLFGERGTEALDELVELGIVERERDGKVRYREETLISFDCDYLLDQIRNSAEVFDRSLLGTNAARVWHMSAGVNKEGLDKIRDIVSAAYQAISEVNEDRKYFGKIPYFAGLLMNVYDKKTLKEEDGEQ
jgi:hypothetical protein